MRRRQRIAAARLTRIALPVGSQWSKRFGAVLARTIIQLTADDGTHGHGECSGDVAGFAAARELAGRLIGVDARAPRVASRLLGRAAPAAPALVGAFETAAIDLMARLLDAPLVELLGGSRPAPVRAAGLIDLAERSDACLARAGMLQSRGYAGAALLGSDDPRADAEAINALREHLGPEEWLAVIGRRQWRLADALRLGRATEAACLAYIAEPVAGIDDLRRLRRDVRTPLASALPAERPDLLAPLLREARLDVLVAGCMLQGPLGVADLAANALAYQRELAMPPLPGCGLAAAADLHLASALPQVNHPLIDMVGIAPTHCVVAPPTHDAGVWRLPDGPGIGAVPDDAALAGHVVETVEAAGR
jgi:L-alanine-DL-glutamate epimerase-like enolase superfamily enzyme